MTSPGPDPIHKKQSSHVVWQTGTVTHEERCSLLGQQGRVIWFTGLSGAGKTTIAHLVERELMNRGRAVYLLDGDNLRHGLNSDLHFTKEDRDENIRRIAEVASLMKDAGLIVLVAVISPYTAMREFAKKRIGEDCFLEVYVKAGIKTCMQRDPKGFYAKVARGEIENYTGVDAPYEVPVGAGVVVDTERVGKVEGGELVLGEMGRRGFL